MKKFRQQVREFMPMAAIMLLCLALVPVAQANSSNNGNSAATQHLEAQQTTAIAAPGNAPATKAKPKAATQSRQKSVLDAEVLESPFEYFRNAFSSEEDEADVAPNSGTVMITVKALVATLLSTIL